VDVRGNRGWVLTLERSAPPYLPMSAERATHLNAWRRLLALLPKPPSGEFSKPAGLMRDPLRYRSGPLCTVAGPYPPPRDVVIRVKYTSIAFAANGLAIGNAAANPWGSRDMPT
jgi:hypothetical protein